MRALQIESQIDTLATIAATTAMRATADYMRLNQVHVSDFQAATDVIREEIHATLGEALSDAKKALEAGMDRIAEATFKASMVQAGINAGKRIESNLATCSARD